METVMPLYNAHRTGPTRQTGFSLIEMMLAMLIGMVIMGGILSIYSNTRETQRSSSDQLQLVADARFAIDTLAYDLRHAGVFGGTNLPTTIKCYKDDTLCTTALAAAVNDCYANWYNDIVNPISGGEDAIPGGYGCIADHQPNTDVLVVRYADSNPIETSRLASSTVYVRSNYLGGELFIGTSIPTIPGDDETDPTTILPNQLTLNHLLYSRAYYVSNHTETPGDGRPSLHRVDLVAGTTGPAVEDQLILPGVEDLQVQYGVDTNGDKWVDQYVNADAVTDWSKVYAAKVWVLVRSEHKEKDLDTTNSFTLGGKSPVDLGGPGDYRRLLVSSVVRLRNMQRFDEASAPGG
jgi:type IV pilus assembly protein PilW